MTTSMGSSKFARKNRTTHNGRSLPLSRGPRAVTAMLKREPNELKRKMLMVGYISERLTKEGGAVFLVGGQAVETYTAGQFITGDIDITTTDTKATERALAQMGFVREGMLWVNRTLRLAVHVVADYPTRSERVRTIEVGPYKVRVVGIEDLILDRLRAFKFWKSERDGEQAKVLYQAFRESIDLDYLRKQAKQDGVKDVLPT